jgi:hypothetical protein
MKIITDRAVLNRVIKQVEPFVPRQGDAEVSSLESVLFSTDKDGALVLTAQSNDRAVEMVTDPDEITVEGDVQVLITLNALKTALAATGNDDEEEVTVEVRGKKRLVITAASGAVAEIGVMPIYDDTILPSVARITTGTPSVELKVSDFTHLYRVGGQARRLTPDYPNLCAVHLELSDEVLTATSTDKRASVYTSAPARSIGDDAFAVLVQPNAANEVLALFDKNDMLSLSVGNVREDGSAERKYAHFVNGDGTIHAVTIGPSYDISGYPKEQLLGLLKGFVAGGSTYRLVVNKDSIINLFKSAEKMSTLNTQGKELLMKLTKSKLEVSLNGDNTFVQSIPVEEWTGPEGTTLEVRWDAYHGIISSFPADEDGNIRVAFVSRKDSVVGMAAFTEASKFNPLAKDPELPEDYFCLVPVKESV